MSPEPLAEPHLGQRLLQNGSAVAAIGVGVATFLYVAAGTQTQVLALAIQANLLFGCLLHPKRLGWLPPHVEQVGQILERDKDDLGMPRLVNVLTDIQTLVELLDDLVRDCVLTKLAGLGEEVRRLASGRIIFENTETWRTAYEKVLRAPDVTTIDLLL